MGIVDSNLSLFSIPMNRNDKKIIIETEPESPSNPSIKLNELVKTITENSEKIIAKDKFNSRSTPRKKPKFCIKKPSAYKKKNAKIKVKILIDFSSYQYSYCRI